MKSLISQGRGLALTRSLSLSLSHSPNALKEQITTVEENTVLVFLMTVHLRAVAFANRLY